MSGTSCELDRKEAQKCWEEEWGAAWEQNERSWQQRGERLKREQNQKKRVSRQEKRQEEELRHGKKQRKEEEALQKKNFWLEKIRLKDEEAWRKEEARRQEFERLEKEMTGVGEALQDEAREIRLMEDAGVDPAELKERKNNLELRRKETQTKRNRLANLRFQEKRKRRREMAIDHDEAGEA
jgi:hypothetical protein